MLHLTLNFGLALASFKKKAKNFKKSLLKVIQFLRGMCIHDSQSRIVAVRV